MSSTDSTLPSPWVRASRRRRRWPFVLVGVLVVLAAAVVYCAFKTAPYYELVPGDAQPVSQLVSVPSGRAHALSGKVLLTDVGVNNMTYLSFIQAWLDPNADVVPAGELTANLPVSEFDAQGTVDMEESQLTAESVALRQLGYQVPETDAGVTAYVIDPNGPSWNVLHVGDVITAINGIPTPNPGQLVSVLHSDFSPGQTVSVTVGTVTQPTPGHQVSVRLGSTRQGSKVYPLIGIGDLQAPIASMGTQPVYDLPFPIRIDSEGIGGPSAGLAFTLGIIDTLTGGRLTGGKVVAATGTIHPDGTVGDVGGVAQKTVAVEQAGATLFLVPPQELAVARSKATGRLKVEAVANLSQAMADLQALGGQLGDAAKGPPPGPGGHSVPEGWQDSPWT